VEGSGDVGAVLVSSLVGSVVGPTVGVRVGCDEGGLVAVDDGSGSKALSKVGKGVA
jgi:hypothetical protein